MGYFIYAKKDEHVNCNIFAQLIHISKVASDVLFHLDAFKKCLEISSPKSLVVVPLYDLNEDCRPVLKRFCENLQLRKV